MKKMPGNDYPQGDLGQALIPQKSLPV